MNLIKKYLGEANKVDQKQRRIINQFKKEIKNVQRLKYEDIEGLVDDTEDKDLALWTWQENAENNLFDEYAKKLKITYDQLVDWWAYNIDKPMPEKIRNRR